MTSRKNTTNSILAAAVVTAMMSSNASAAVYYRDANDVSAGAGVTPSGTWGSDPYWSTDSTGVSATANTPTTAFDSLAFSAGTDAIGSPTITVNGTQNAQLLTVEDGSPPFTGGTIKLRGSGGTPVGGITNLAVLAGNPTVSSNLSIVGPQSFNVSGHTLALNTGTFTRASGATLNMVTASTVTSTMPNLRAADLSNGIIGPWATVLATTNTRYATINGSEQIVSYTGTAATASSLTDTTGTVNYEITDSGTAPSVSSFNTLRMGDFAVVSLGATSFTLNGLISTDSSGVGSAAVNPNTKITIGSNRELVINNAVSGTNMQLNTGVQDNAAGASGLTKTGAGSLFVQEVNTYTGTTTVNQGSFNLRLGGSLADTGALVVNGGTFTLNGLTAASETIGSLASLPGTTVALTSKNLTTGGNGDSTTVAGTIAGATGGSLTKQGAGTMTLTGANTYTGGTTINAGTLLANNTTGSATGTGSVTVNGGTFGGTGAITGSVNVTGTSGSDATLSPGASIESLAVGGLSMTGIYSHFNPEIDLGSTLNADLLNVTGTVSLNLARLDVSLLNVPTSQTLPLTFLVIANDGSDPVNLNSQTDGFGIISNPIGFGVSVDYAFTGTDALGRIGDGNDVALRVGLVPEPTSIGLISAIGVIALRRKSR